MLAAPTPIPPITRQTINSIIFAAVPAVVKKYGFPEPIALIKNKMLDVIITLRRPNLSAKAPAKKAPPAAPKTAMEAASPSWASFAPSLNLRASRVPFITEVSKPNKKPPIAAAQAMNNA